MTGCVTLANAAFATLAFAQQAAPPVRAVSAPIAVTAEPMQQVSDLREIGGGNVLVHLATDRRLVVFDPSLAHVKVVADTMNAGAARYSLFTRLIAYAADSTLMVDQSSQTFVLIDPQGTLGRSVAPPRARDFNLFMSNAPSGTDQRGNLVYQGQRPFVFPPSCRVIDGIAKRDSLPPGADSVYIIRASFETRTVDTIGRAKVVLAGYTFSIATDANCKMLSAKTMVNPSIQPSDAWTVTSNGSVAIVRGHDYHVDFIDADGTKRSGAKLPYDWRRLTDNDKQARIDSARRVIDSLTALGGYRLEVCGGNSSMFSVEPLPPKARTLASGMGDGGGAMGAVGGRGGGGGVAAGNPSALLRDCQTVTVAAEFVPLDQMADYIAPVRENSAKPDLDGNIWILPSTSLGAKGGLLYDVISPKGELTERVQLPGGRDIAGFGKGGVLYLTQRISATGVAVEKVKVVR
jgi:hypothetical protein